MDENKDKIEANTPTEENTPEYSYDDIHKPDTRDIASEVPVVEEKPKEEAPKEPEKSVVEETPKVEEPPIDPKELVSQIAKETAKEIAESNKVIEPEKSAAEQYLEDAKAKGKTPSWEDALNFVSEQGSKKALDTLHAEQAAIAKVEEDRVNTQKAEQKAIEDNNQKVLDTYNKTVDIQLQELIDEGRLSAIKDKDNPNDPGVVERKALFQSMLEVNQERLKQGRPAIYSVKEIYAFHYTKPTVTPPGADAPISMGKGNNNAAGKDEELDYNRDVRGKSWNFFKRGG